MTGSSSGMPVGLIDLVGTDIFHDSMALICWLPRYGCDVADVELDELVVEAMLEAFRLLLCCMLLSVSVVSERLLPGPDDDMVDIESANPAMQNSNVSEWLCERSSCQYTILAHLL